MIETSYSQLTDENKELLDSAEKALENAYNPYGGRIKVAAAVRTTSKDIVTGASYVNLSSPSSICAERAVIITANSLGKREIETMAIIGMKEGGVINPVTPCGNCRQVMHEAVSISGKDMTVICSNDDKSKIIITSLNELLPLPYGK